MPDYMKEIDQDRDWNCEAGMLPLDFANTAEWHASSQPLEKLKSYSHLVAWSRAAGLLTEREAQHLLADSEDHPDKASAALTKAIELRETIYRIFSAVANGKEADTTDLEKLCAAHTEASTRTQIVPTPNGFEWDWVAGKESLDRMLWPIARAAATLLTSEDLDRLGQCADDRGCGWLFLDTSRNRSRRWCSMESCGNRAKARRHYRRQKQKRSELG
jgi:predicted RNA-binding Zn ribbon-like protein